MKKVLLLMLSLFFAVQFVSAQSEDDDDDVTTYAFHDRIEGASITVDCTPEQVAAFILKGTGDNYSLYPNTSLEVHKKRTDKYGNYHVSFNQVQDGESSGYQAMLHFHPDGSLYYINGKLAIMETEAAANAKSRGASKVITPEEAAIIATGDATSQATLALVNHKNTPRETYKVVNQKLMRYVYVDVYTGEVLFTMSMFRHFAPWEELNGTTATVMANTMYNGAQSIDVMQTENGYVLRDSKRNIVTLDATNKLDNYPKNFPKDLNEQGELLLDTSEDFLFTDKQQFMDCEYDPALNSIKFIYYTWGSDKPGPVKVHAYYVDEDMQPLDDIIDIVLSDTAWVHQFNGYKLEYILPQPIALNLFDEQHSVDFSHGGYIYRVKNLLNPGNKVELVLDTDEMGAKKLGCWMGVGVSVSQPALDAHWGIQQVYDMYHDYFGIQGCDNNGCQMVNIVNPTNKLNLTEDLPTQAFAMATLPVDSNGVKRYLMIYGLGKPGVEKCLTPLDIIAHEYTHNVTEGCGTHLEYKDESGALDEALADCMAMVTEYYVNGESSWQIGEGTRLDSKNLRNFSNPWLSKTVDGSISPDDAQPKYYGGQYWVDYNTTDIDEGGVHTNSGVFNYLFYLLCEGEQGALNEKDEPGYITPIGIDRMKDIIFHSMVYYNSGLCDYGEIADNMLVAVEDLNGQNQSIVNDLQDKMRAAYSYVGMTSTIEPTGIAPHRAAGAKVQNSPAYNVNGFPVGNDYKGVVIKNGQKIRQNF